MWACCSCQHIFKKSVILSANVADVGFVWHPDILYIYIYIKLIYIKLYDIKHNYINFIK